MSTSPHVIAVPGSLRDGSYTRLAVEHALDAAGIGVPRQNWSTCAGTTSRCSTRTTTMRATPRLSAGRFREADSVILGSPMYHGSYAAPLKNAIDYCGFDEFEETTVGLLGVSGGQFPITTLEHLRSVCRALNAWVLPHQAAVPRASFQFAEGAFVDDSVASRVETLGHRVVEYARIEPDPASFESEQNVGAED